MHLRAEIHIGAAQTDQVSVQKPGDFNVISCLTASSCLRKAGHPWPSMRLEEFQSHGWKEGITSIYVASSKCIAY